MHDIDIFVLFVTLSRSNCNQNFQARANVDFLEVFKNILLDLNSGKTNK